MQSCCYARIGANVISKAQSSWELGRAVLAFSMGSISSVGPTQVGMVLCVAVIGFAASMSWHRHLDMLLTGDDEARAFGLDVRQIRRWRSEERRVGEESRSVREERKSQARGAKQVQ